MTLQPSVCSGGGESIQFAPVQTCSFGHTPVHGPFSKWVIDKVFLCMECVYHVYYVSSYGLFTLYGNGTGTNRNNWSWFLSWTNEHFCIRPIYPVIIPSPVSMQCECIITATFKIIDFLNTNCRTIKSKGVFTRNEIL